MATGGQTLSSSSGSEEESGHRMSLADMKGTDSTAGLASLREQLFDVDPLLADTL